ncbi:MAG: hypothetical protein LBJ64_02130 [Deltaproteobacteria bacterium]|nr:hypothetical protein [Deltaproteobacteria bacterium]
MDSLPLAGVTKGHQAEEDPQKPRRIPKSQGGFPKPERDPLYRGKIPILSSA